MRVIKPKSEVGKLLIESNVSETESMWSSTTSYALGALVCFIRYEIVSGINGSTTTDVMETNGIYKSAVSGNLNNQPDISTDKWIWVSPANKYAMFDSQISTQTTSTSDIIVDINTGTSDSFAVFNVEGESVSLVINDAASTVNPVYSSTQSLQGSAVLDWYQYFYFDETDIRTQAVFLNIPISSSTAISTLTIAKGSGTYTAVGNVSFGTLSTIGRTNYGMSAGITDYSTKETDEYGSTVFTIRDYSKKITAEVQIDNFDLNRVQRTLYALRATPAVWVSTMDARYEESSVVFGFYRDFSISITYPTHSRCSLEIEGLI